MRINELLSENQQIDELSLAGVGKAAGNVIRGTSKAVQGAKGAWQGAKDAWAQGKQSGTYDAARAAVSGVPAGTPPATQQPAPQQSAPAQQNVAPAAATGAATTQTTGVDVAAEPAGIQSNELDQLKATLDKLNTDQKKELAGELEKSMKEPPAEPVSPHTAAEREAHKAAGGKFDPQTGQMIPLAQPAAGGNTATIDPAKAQADRAAKNAADAAERDQQIAATKQANATAAQADSELVAAVKAAKAKPAFQQTAQDKLTIKQGAEKGIHESKKKKKKVVAEFNSKFLGMQI